MDIQTLNEVTSIKREIPSVINALARPRTQLTVLRDMRKATIWNCLINDILLVRAALGTHNILS